MRAALTARRTELSCCILSERFQATLSQMYDKFSLLKKTFDHWDIDNDGKVHTMPSLCTPRHCWNILNQTCTHHLWAQITIEEFTQGVAKLNEVADDGSMHLDAAELFSLVDLDSSGEIDINEFCEAFRLSRDALVGSMRWGFSYVAMDSTIILYMIANKSIEFLFGIMAS